MRRSAAGRGLGRSSSWIFSRSAAAARIRERPALVIAIRVPRRSSGSRERTIRPSASRRSSRFVIAPTTKHISSAVNRVGGQGVVARGGERAEDVRLSMREPVAAVQVIDCAIDVRHQAIEAGPADTADARAVVRRATGGRADPIDGVVHRSQRSAKSTLTSRFLT